MSAAKTKGLTVLPDGPALMSIAEAADALGIHQTTAHRAILNDEFPVPVTRVGGRLKVSRCKLDAFLCGNSTTPTPNVGAVGQGSGR